MISEQKIVRHDRGTAVIRPASMEDDAAVTQLFGALHAYNASLEPRLALADGWEQVLAEHLQHGRAAGHGLTLLAWHREAPVGLLMMDGHTDSPLFCHRHWAELLALYVSPKVRGGGVADQLVTQGVTWARARGYAHVQLYVTATNARARRFYTRGGFRPIQEIWAAVLDFPGEQPPENEDAACESAHAQGHYLLSPTPHPAPHFEPCPEPE